MCRREDGQLTYLGRQDSQLKLRGVRIEPAEIEATIRSLPGVKEAAVILADSGSDGPRLIGYFSPVGLDAIEGLDRLRTLLPAIQVPSSLVALEELPRLPNGKLDRGALPIPEKDRWHRRAAPPQTMTERQVLSLWREIFGDADLDCEDNFFALGGDSLLAIRLLAKVHQVTRVRLSLDVLFRAPTVRELALLVDQGGYCPEWSSLVPIQPAGSRKPFFCVHGGGGHVLFLQPLAACLGSDQPFFGLQERHIGGLFPPARTLEEMAEHYLREIRLVQPRGPYCLGGVSYGGVIAFCIARRLVEAGESISALLMFDTLAPGYGWSSRPPTRTQRLHARLLGFEHHLRSLARLRGKRRVSYITERVRRKSLEVAEDARAALLRRLSTHHSSPGPIGIPGILASFEPGEYAGKITLLTGDRTPPVREPDACLGWGPHVSGVIERIQVRGYHAGILSEVWVHETADQVRRVLDGAQ